MTATILGSTGLVGSELVKLLLADPYFTTVRIIVRRPLAAAPAGLEVKLVNFKDAESLKLALEGTNVIFSCIGTTQKNVRGNKGLYREIDFDIPANAARFGKETGCEKFIYVSSVGANPSSGSFYLRLKGELEQALAASGLRQVHALQPSLILGPRMEKRSGEKLLQGTFGFISGFFPGGLRKYRAIQARTIALAMIGAARSNENGFFRHTYDDIMRLSKLGSSKA